MMTSKRQVDGNKFEARVAGSGDEESMRSLLVVVVSATENRNARSCSREIRDIKGSEKDELDQRKSGANPVRAVELGREQGVRKECASCKR